MTTKNNPLKHIDILDLVTIDLYHTGVATMPGHVSVSFTPLEVTKRVIFDESAKKVLEEKILERAANKDLKDPKIANYIKEFAGRMLSELYKNGLVLLEEIPDAPNDPYWQVKQQLKNTRG